MQILPVITEKTLSDAKKGKFTFKVARHLTKYQIRKMIEKYFSVHVVTIRTVKKSAENKRSIYGRKTFKQSVKKAVVTLKEKEKIDLFETKS